MTSVTWRYLSGDTSAFAVEFALVTPDSTDWMVSEDERASWGSFAMWVHGINIFEYHVQGETLHSAHWYLIPIAEWLADNWEPLLHEERLPVPEGAAPPQGGPTAARYYTQLATLAEQDALDRGDTTRAELLQQWYGRHGLRAAAPGALMPDVYIRRYGDRIEFSATAERPAGADWGISFRETVGTRIAVDVVAAALHDGLTALIQTLRRRHPSNERYQAVEKKLSRMRDGDREPERIAWLAGASGHVQRFSDVWQQVQNRIPTTLSAGLRDAISSRSLADGLTMDAPPATLLFGSTSPNMSGDDLATLFTALLTNLDNRAPARGLSEVGAAILADHTRIGELSAGEAGGILGEEAWRILADTADARVDARRILNDHGVKIDDVDIRDTEIRAVSMVADEGTAVIVLNNSFRNGVNPAVQRFSLAHELAHLLLDQERAAHMVVASGPWAPPDIEQRANAFAAAFLAPSPLLDSVWRQSTDTLGLDDVRGMATALGISLSVLIRRLQNTGRITDATASSLLDSATN